MDRRAAVPVVFAVLLLAAPAAGDPGAEKAGVDARLGELRGRIDEAGRQTGVLTSELSSLSARVRAAQSQIADEQSRLDTLEAELATRRARLVTLERRIADQTARLVTLAEQHAIAVAILEERVRELYMADSPDMLSFVLGTDSFADVLDNVELLQRIGRQDKRIMERVIDAERSLDRLRAETRRDRAEAAEAERFVSAQTQEQRAARDRVVAGRDALMAAEREKSAALASIRETSADFLREEAELESQSADLATRILATNAAAQAAQAAQPAHASTSPSPAARLAAPAQAPSASGFIWPVNGTLVSGFGMRGSRMHEGLDITAPFGVPVIAVAAGTVTRAEWAGGFGNLVVVDHGGGLQTYYAHNASLTVSPGQTVAQGQVIALVGSTGNSSGPHVHLEVHDNGTPVDPLGYL